MPHGSGIRNCLSKLRRLSTVTGNFDQSQAVVRSQGLTSILHALSLAHSTLPLEVLVKQNFHLVDAQEAAQFSQRGWP